MHVLKKYGKMVRPFDIIIIALLIVFSFVPTAVFAWQQTHIDPNAETVAIISIDGEEVERFVLSEDTPHQLVTYYPAEGQYNIIEVQGTAIRVKQDNSPDQIAVRTGWISRPGQTSICLPHRLIIRIESSSPSEQEEIIISS